MKVTNIAGECSMEWESFDEFVPELRATMERDARARGVLKGHGINNQSWFGASTGQTVLERIEKGWPDLREKLERMLSDVEQEVPRFPTESHIRRRKRRFADSGDELVRERLWNGQLDTAWVKPTRVERLQVNQKCVTLALDVTASALVTNDQAMWRAALCMLLINSLAKAGRTLEIWVIDSTYGPFVNYASGVSAKHGKAPNKLWAGWRVKASNEPLVMDRLAAMVSIGFLRTCGFVAMHSVPEWQVSGGYGSPLDTGLPHVLRERQARGETVLRIGRVFSKSDALAQYQKIWAEVEANMEDAA